MALWNSGASPLRDACGELREHGLNTVRVPLGHDDAGAKDPFAAGIALSAYLWGTTLEKVAIDQPRYSRYRREVARRTRQ